MTAKIARLRILKEAKDEKKGLILVIAIALLGSGCVTEKRAGSDLEFNQHLSAATKYFQQGKLFFGPAGAKPGFKYRFQISSGQQPDGPDLF